MSDGKEVSHLEIYKLLMVVKTTVDITLKQRVEDKNREDKEKADIFKRLGSLETRMGQVVVIALLLSVAIPITVELVSGRLLHFGDLQIERQR